MAMQKTGEMKYSVSWITYYSTWMRSQKWQNDLSSFPRQGIQNITVIQVYAPTTDAKEAEVD